MSLVALLIAALGPAVSPAAAPGRFADVADEFRQVAEDALRPLPSFQLHIPVETEQTQRTPAPRFDPLRPGSAGFHGPRSSLRSDIRPHDGTRLPPLGIVKRHTPDPSVRGGHIKVYDAPSGFGRPLPPPFDDFETLRLRSERR